MEPKVLQMFRLQLDVVTYGAQCVISVHSVTVTVTVAVAVTVTVTASATPDPSLHIARLLTS